MSDIYTDEELAQCEIDSPFSSTTQETTGEGTHYFRLEPVPDEDGEAAEPSIELKKRPRNSSETLGDIENYTIINMVREAIGRDCEWCEVEIVDEERSTDMASITGYVKRHHLTRLINDEMGWEGETTPPSPPFLCTGMRKAPKALVPNWIRRSACEPFLNRKTLKYCTAVSTGYKNLDEVELLEEQAIGIGIKQLMIYYDRLPAQYDVYSLDEGIAFLQDEVHGFASVEDVHVSTRPDEKVKALVCVDAAHLLAVPRMKRTFVTTTQMQTGHRTALYQSNTIKERLKTMADTFDKLQPFVDYFPGTIRGPQKFSCIKQAKQVRKYLPALKKLFKANGYTLREEHEDMIEIGTDSEFNPSHVIVYKDGVGVPQTIGFNAYATQAPAASQRIMHYVMQGNNMFSDARTPDMKGPMTGWMTYLTSYTYPPLEIRPTAPSGGSVSQLAVPSNTAEHAKVKNQFNSLPVKGPASLGLENVKLGDVNFMNSMALARADIALPSGDNIVANLSDVLDKIHTLDDVFGELLQKISIPKLIEQAMAKLMAELGLDNIYAAMLSAVLGQFSLETLINQFLMELPDDIFQDLLSDLIDAIDFSCDDLIKLIVNTGVTQDHLQGIADQIGDAASALQEQLDTFASAASGIGPCSDGEDAEISTSIEDDAEETVDSIEKILENLTCEDLTTIVKDITFNGIPSFDFEPPTIDLSCFVVDFEKLLGTIIMPALIPLAGAPLDVTRLGNIDWSGLEASTPNIKFASLGGGGGAASAFYSITDAADLGDLEAIPGLSMPWGAEGTGPSYIASELNYPQLVLGGTDASTGDLTASPGGVQLPNIKLAEEFADVEFPGGVETLIESLGALADGAIPGLSLEELGPDGDANLDEALEDMTFGELLDDVRRIMTELVSGMLLNNFPIAIANGGSVYTKFLEAMENLDWGSEATMDIPETEGETITSSALQNIPTWDPTSTVGTSVVPGVGWQSLASMPSEWWEAMHDTDLPIFDAPDYTSLATTASDAGHSALSAALAALAVYFESEGTSSPSDPCELMDLTAVVDDVLEDIDEEDGTYTLDDGTTLTLDELQLPTAIYRSSSGRIYKVFGEPDFGLSGLSLPLPIVGPNGDETFDLFDMDNLLEKLPEVPNFAAMLPDGIDSGDIALACDLPELLEALFSLFLGDMPTVAAAMSMIESQLTGLTQISSLEGGTAQGVSAKRIAQTVFQRAKDEIGFDSIIEAIADTLKSKMSAGDLDVSTLTDIPAIKEKFDKLIAGTPSLPTGQLPALPGIDLEVPSLNIPGIGGLGSGFSIPTITLPDNIPTGDLMGALFAGMQEAVKGAIEQALVEMGKSILRSLLDSGSDSLADASFGEADITDMLSSSLGSYDNALSIIDGAFENIGIDSDGNVSPTTTSTTTSTTVTIEMGCGEAEEIDTADPDNVPCTPYEFVASLSQRLTSAEIVDLLEGKVPEGTCGVIQEMILDGCKTYALVFDDCDKIAETFEAIGEFVDPDILDEKRKPVSLIPDLKRLCTDADIDESAYRQNLSNKGLSDDDVDDQMEAIIQKKQDALEDLANLLADVQDADSGLDPNGILAGDGHGGTVVPQIYPDQNCAASCDDEEEPPESLLPSDDEIPVMAFLNDMAINLMYEPTKQMFKMESEAFPEMLISGTLKTEAIPFYEPLTTYDDQEEAGISGYADMLFAQGNALCDENGDRISKDFYSLAKKLVKGVGTLTDAADGNTILTPGTFHTLGLTVADGGIHVMKQNQSGAVVPLLYDSLQDFDYTSNTWDTDAGTFSWDFQYGGTSDSATGDDWPTISWEMAAVTETDLSSSTTTAASSLTVPSTNQTYVSAIMGEYCGEDMVIDTSTSVPSNLSATLTSSDEEEDEDSLIPRLSIESGTPLQYQVFKQFLRNKFIDHPNVAEGVSVTDLDAWTDLEMDEDGDALPFSEVYQQIMNQLVQSAGIQITFTDLFNATNLRILQLEPNDDAAVDACGEQPKSLLDLDGAAKNATKDAFGKACVSPEKEAASGKNALKQAGLNGCIQVTARVYVIDQILRAIFALSEFELLDFTDSFVTMVADKMTAEMQAIDINYYNNFMEELPPIVIAMCEAAACEEDPLLDPLTGEEVDCDDLSGDSALNFLIKQHLMSTSSLLKEKFGTSTPNVGVRLLEDWLVTLPLPEYPVELVDDVSTLSTQSDLLGTLLINPRPEVSTSGLDTYYYDEVNLVYTATDITATNDGELIDSDFPDNIPSSRLITYSETEFSMSDITVISDAGGTEAYTTADEAADFLEVNPYNSTYYNLTDNWAAPEGGDVDPEDHTITSTVTGGLYLEKFIKIGDEYWNADNAQEWFEQLIELAEGGDTTAYAALSAYSEEDAEYGLRLCYMTPGDPDDSFVELLQGMFGEGATSGIPDVAQMQGSYLQIEGENFNVEVDAEIEVEIITTTTDSSSGVETESSATTTVTATAIEGRQERHWVLSIPLAETTVSAGSAISATISDTATEDEDGEFPAIEDIESYDTPWTDAATALDNNLSDLRTQLLDTDDYKILFQYCFSTNNVVEMLWNYCAMMTDLSVNQLDTAFAATKDELYKLFLTLYNDAATGDDGFSFRAETTATSMQEAQTNVDTNPPSKPPLPIKMALMTIPLLFKGIAEAIDPNIKIAKLIRIAADGDQGKIGKFPSTLMALPFNIIPPPPFGPGIGPPITPIGLAYLALGALTPLEKENLRFGNSASGGDGNEGATGGDADASDCNPNSAEEA